MSGFIFFIIICFIVILSAVKSNKTKRQYWFAGEIDNQISFNDNNLLAVYCALAVLVLKGERKETKEKIKYLVSYLKRKFPRLDKTARHEFSYALKDDNIKIKPAARWLNIHLEEHEKIQLIQFLCDICFIDGRLNKSEEKLIAKLSVHLKVPIEEVRSIVAGIESRYYRKHDSSNQNKVKNKPKYSSKRKRMAAILEVSENSKFEEIKKSYRRLVKLHHPDRFQNKGDEQIQLAKERFVEIQLAYEYFEKLLN